MARNDDPLGLWNPNNRWTILSLNPLRIRDSPRKPVNRTIAHYAAWPFRFFNPRKVGIDRGIFFETAHPQERGGLGFQPTKDYLKIVGLDEWLDSSLNIRRLK